MHLCVCSPKFYHVLVCDPHTTVKIQNSPTTTRILWLPFYIFITVLSLLPDFIFFVHVCLVSIKVFNKFVLYE